MRTKGLKRALHPRALPAPAQAPVENITVLINADRMEPCDVLKHEMFHKFGCTKYALFQMINQHAELTTLQFDRPNTFETLHHTVHNYTTPQLAIIFAHRIRDTNPAFDWERFTTQLIHDRNWLERLRSDGLTVLMKHVLDPGSDVFNAPSRSATIASKIHWYWDHVRVKVQVQDDQGLLNLSV